MCYSNTPFVCSGNTPWCVNEHSFPKVCFHNTPWCVNLHTPKTHLIMCYFKDMVCSGNTLVFTVYEDEEEEDDFFFFFFFLYFRCSVRNQAV